jgi:hypothetical protein
MARPVVEAAPVAENDAPVAVGDVPPTRDFALPKKKWYGRGISGVAAFAGGFMGMFPAVFIGVMTASAIGTGGAAGIVVVVIGACIAASENGHRNKEADFFKKLFERDQPYGADQAARTRAATTVIGAMNPEISTDQFVGVMNSLFESKKVVDPELRGSVNNISVAKRAINEVAEWGTEVTRNMNNKAVSQFLVLNSMLDVLMNNEALLPRVDRQELTTKFTEFSERFVEHCEARYPKKMTDDIAARIRSIPAAHVGRLNVGGGAVAGADEVRLNDRGVVAVEDAAAGADIPAAVPLAGVEVVDGAQLAPPNQHEMIP